MTNKLKTSPLQSRHLMPAAAAAAALGLVALAVLVPLPSFTPGQTATRTLPVAQSQTIEPPEQFVTGDWSTLVDKLVALRPPPPLPPPTVVVPVEEVENTDDVLDLVKPALPVLGWTYAGRIEDVTPFALVFMPNGKQRFLRQGQSINDPTNPRGQQIVIKEILADTLIIERDGVEQRLPLITTSNAPPTTTQSDVLPGDLRANPRGPGAMNPTSR